MSENADIDAFLAFIKSDERSSPAGFAWHEFWEWLKGAAPDDAGKPPVPLILAASGDSAASKHFQLGEQLHWAAKHELLSEAIDKLKAIPSDKWNHSPPDRWDRTSHSWE